MSCPVSPASLSLFLLAALQIGAVADKLRKQMSKVRQQLVKLTAAGFQSVERFSEYRN